jgi:predicted dehydrogenase
MKRFKNPGQIKGAVIGYSPAFNMGRAHLNEMRQAGMAPTAVVDINGKCLETAKTDFPGIETYTSVSRMLRTSAANFVAIITPHNTHADLAVQCLRAGRHVVCEKPFAITTAECDRMIAAARKHKLMLSTYHNRHWDGCILEAVKRIRAGEIGEVFRVAAHMADCGRPGDWWRSSKSISGGVLYDWGVHLLEYSLQILDSDIQEVSGFYHRGFWASQTAWKKDANEDEGFAVVRFTNGKHLTLRISSLEASAPRGWLEITGTKGTYIFDHQTWEIVRVTDGMTVSTKGQNPQGQPWRFYQNMTDHLVKGEPLVITPEWARRPIHILDLADRSARLGRSLKATYR